MPGQSEDEFVDMLVCEFEDKIRELGGADHVMAYFAEPVMGAGGVIVAPDGYNRRMWEICQKYDILYVSDEVVTAFGRLGHWFASQDEFGIQPDIIITAKGITSGYLPLGAAIFSDRIWSVISDLLNGQRRMNSNGLGCHKHSLKALFSTNSRSIAWARSKSFCDS